MLGSISTLRQNAKRPFIICATPRGQLYLGWFTHAQKNPYVTIFADVGRGVTSVNRNDQRKTGSEYNLSVIESVSIMHVWRIQGPDIRQCAIFRIAHAREERWWESTPYSVLPLELPCRKNLHPSEEVKCRGTYSYSHFQREREDEKRLEGDWRGESKNFNEEEKCSSSRRADQAGLGWHRPIRRPSTSRSSLAFPR